MVIHLCCGFLVTNESRSQEKINLFDNNINIDVNSKPRSILNAYFTFDILWKDKYYTWKL